MVIRSICAHLTENGETVQIAFEVSAKVWENMEASAKNGWHPNVLDYIAANIGTAFMEDEEPPARPYVHVPNPDDCDDDLPF